MISMDGIRAWAFVTLTAAVVQGVVYGQTTQPEPIRATLRELVREPEHFKRKLVEIRAECVSRFQWTGFVAESCSARVQIGAYHVFDDLKPEQGQYALKQARLESGVRHRYKFEGPYDRQRRSKPTSFEVHKIAQECTILRF